MDELDRYVNFFVEKYSDVKDFRFLHPYLENDTICFSTRDESRLAALNLAKVSSFVAFVFTIISILSFGKDNTFC